LGKALQAVVVVLLMTILKAALRCRFIVAA
jgi:hypothetical protein